MLPLCSETLLMSFWSSELHIVSRASISILEAESKCACLSADKEN